MLHKSHALRGRRSAITIKPAITLAMWTYRLWLTYLDGGFNVVVSSPTYRSGSLLAGK